MIAHAGHRAVCELHNATQRTGAEVRFLRVREIFCGLLLVASASSLGAGEQMTMKVSPEVAYAPADLVVQASIEASPDNRAIEVVVDSPDFYRSSLIELEGARRPALRCSSSETCRAAATWSPPGCSACQDRCVLLPARRSP